jgi:hypothetical protein
MMSQPLYGFADAYFHLGAAVEVHAEERQSECLLM